MRQPATAARLAREPVDGARYLARGLDANCLVVMNAHQFEAKLISISGLETVISLRRGRLSAGRTCEPGQFSSPLSRTRSQNLINN